MWKLTLTGILARKVRLALTALAVLLGVSFVAGTYTLTDTARRAFDGVFSQTAVGVDLVVRSEGTSTTRDLERERMPDGIVDVVSGAPGVAAAEGVISGTAKLVGRDGDVIQSAGAPTIGFSWPTTTGLGPLRLVDDGVSRAPRAEDEIVIDQGTADEEGFEVGDTIRAQLQQEAAREFTITGLVGFGDVTELGSVTVAAFPLATAQEGFGATGLVDWVFVETEPDVSVAQVQRELEQLLPGFEVSLADEFSDDLAEPVREGIGLLNNALLGFAAIGVFAGGFIIFNTFMVLISQRTRELGLVRAVGASNRQVIGSVLTEALATGVLGSIAGIVLGVALAQVLLGVLPDLGFEVPEGPTVVLGRTLWLSAAVGIGVTVLGAIIPAVRASRIPPVAAINDIRPGSVAPMLRRSLTGVATILVGAGVVAYGLADRFASIEVAARYVLPGLILVFLGIFLLGPPLARPLARVVGTPAAGIVATVAGLGIAVGATVQTVIAATDGRWLAAAVAVLVVLAGVALVTAGPASFGVLGRLAQGNAARNPRRTNVTAAAVAIGLTLVCTVAIVGQSFRESVTDAIDRGLRAQLAVTADNLQSFSPKATAAVREVDGVEAVAGLRYAGIGVGGEREWLTGVDVVDLAAVADLGFRSGVMPAPGSTRQLAVNADFADEHGVGVGDVIEVEVGRMGPVPLEVSGVFENTGWTGTYPVDFVATLELFEQGYGDAQLDSLAFVRITPSADLDAVQDRVEAVLVDPFPDVRVQTAGEYEAEQQRTIDLVVNVLFALLVWSLVIAIIGVINTLFLSVFERTRELGLLRVVGMSPQQLRRIVRGESVIIAVIGSVFGIVAGLLWGWAFTVMLRSQGVTRFAVPPLQLAVFLALAAAAGVVASVLPAWRAGRLDVLDAIAEE